MQITTDIEVIQKGEKLLNRLEVGVEMNLTFKTIILSP